MTALERFTGATVGVLTLVDQFVQLRGTRGPLPAPIPPLRFRLIAREVQAVMTPLVPPIELVAQRGSTSAAYLFADEGRARAGEPAARVPEGRYRLRIESDYYQPHELDLDWPPAASLPAQLLRPGNAYPFPDVTLPSAKVTLLRGTVVRGVAGTPVPDATVSILNPPNLGPFTTTVTDASGAWVLAFRPANANDVIATVRIEIPNEPPLNVPQVVLKAGQDNALSQTSLRGFVKRADGTPIRDAEISVDLVPNESVRTSGDGSWSFYFDLNQADAAAQVTAVAPDGQSDTVNTQVRRRAAVLVPAFQLG